MYEKREREARKIPGVQSQQAMANDRKKRRNDYGFPFKRKTHHTQQVYNFFVLLLKDAAIFLYLGC